MYDLGRSLVVSQFGRSRLQECFWKLCQIKQGKLVIPAHGRVWYKLLVHVGTYPCDATPGLIFP